MIEIGPLISFDRIGINWLGFANAQRYYKFFRRQLDRIKVGKLNLLTVLLAALETINRNHPEMKTLISELFRQDNNALIKLSLIWAPHQDENKYTPLISDLNFLYEYLDHEFNINDDIGNLLMTLRIGMIELHLIDNALKIKEVTNCERFITIFSWNENFWILYPQKNTKVAKDNIRSLCYVDNGWNIVLGCTHRFQRDSETLQKIWTYGRCQEKGCNYQLYNIEKDIIQGFFRQF